MRFKVRLGWDAARDRGLSAALEQWTVYKGAAMCLAARSAVLENITRPGTVAQLAVQEPSGSEVMGSDHPPGCRLTLGWAQAALQWGRQRSLLVPQR